MVLRSRLGCLALSLCALLFLCAPHAQAQGTSAIVPDPMSFSELSRLLKLYDTLTPEQMASVESAHDSYRERFRALREGDIQRFMDNMTKMSGGMPSKQQADELIKGMERVNKQIAEVDDALFESIVTLAGEDHRSAITRARDARTRARASSGAVGSSFGTPLVDLADVTLDLGLTPGERQAVDPTLVSYEPRLTAGLRELNGMSLRMWREMFDELDRAGLGNLSQEDMASDPEKMKAVMEAMQTAMAKAMKPIQAKVGDVLALNQSTFGALSTQLSGKAQRHLRHSYVTKAYPHLGGDPANIERTLLSVLRMKALDSAQRQQIEDLYTRWQATDNAIMDKAMKEADDYHTKHTPMEAMTGAVDWQKSVQEVWEKRNEAGNALYRQLTSILGDDRFRKLADKMNETKAPDFFNETDDPEAPEGGVAEIKVEASAETPVEIRQYVQGLHEPISDQLVNALADQAALDDARRVLLTTLHSDYVKGWEAEMKSLRRAMMEASQKRWRMENEGEEGAHMVSDPAAQKQYAAAERALFDRGTEMDASFFANAESALGADAALAITMARLERSIDRAQAGAQGMQGMWGGFGVDRKHVNVVQVLRTAALTPEERKAAHTALQPRVAALTAKHLEGMQSSQQFQRDYQELSEKSAAVYRGGGGGEQPDMAEMQKVGMAMMELQRKQESVMQALDAESRDAFKTALAALPEARRELLQLAYDQTEYPSIFKDKRSALPYFEKALELKDLSDAQRAQVEAALRPYREEHVKACRAMLPRATPQPSQTDQAAMQQYWQDQMAEANRRETLRFDRDERSQRAVSALRRILTPEQAARIPGLDSYEKAAAKKKNPYGMEEE